MGKIDLEMSKTIFITGVTAGIGAAVARKFVAEGWQAVGTGRRRDRLDALAAELGDFSIRDAGLRCPGTSNPRWRRSGSLSRHRPAAHNAGSPRR
jgi:NAD(P)-dependent dehydrogenase (short-subunit alcohol dehydrogenase family)